MAPLPMLGGIIIILFCSSGTAGSSGLYSSLLSPLCLWLLPSIWRHLCQERVPATQIRLTVMAIGLGAATLLAAGKFITHFLAYRGEHSVLIDLWNDVASWALLVAVLCWASILFFPGRVYGWLAQPLIYLGKYRILQDLRAVETRLHLVATPVVPTPYPWTQRILNTDFHIYLVMLHLLDGQQVLQATLQQSQDDDEKLPQIGALQQVEYWEADLSARAKQLYQLFQEYSTTDDYELLIERYRQLGRRLRKEWILE